MHNERLSPHPAGSGIGHVAAVHLVAAHAPEPARTSPPDATIVEYDVANNPLRDGLLANPLVPIDGFTTVPDARYRARPRGGARFSAQL